MEIQPKDPSMGHFYASLIKSFLRIGAGVALVVAGIETDHMIAFMTTCGGLLVAAEIMGIVEELI